MLLKNHLSITLKALKEGKLLPFCSQAPTMGTVKVSSGPGIAFQHEICYITREEYDLFMLLHCSHSAVPGLCSEDNFSAWECLGDGLQDIDYDAG